MTRFFEKFEDTVARRALMIGAGSLAICLILALWPSMRPQFFNAYLFAWNFWLSIALGGLALTMLHHLTGGPWGTLIRPITTCAAQTLPALFVGFIFVAMGIGYLFPWADAQQVASDPILRHAHPYMNPSMFLARFMIYFAVWIGLTLGLTHMTSASKLRRISAGGLVAYVVLVSLAGVDWIMSRQVHWSSSVFGFILVISQALTALCFAILVLWTRASREPIAHFAKPEHYIDLGNLLLMFLILWAYMNFSQFLITWTGNEQPDVAWYVQRSSGGWRVVAGIIIFIHFLLPLILLLMRYLKGDIRRLGTISAGLFLLRVLDLYWTIGPQVQNDPRSGFVLSPLDVLAWLGVGGIWYAVFLHYLKRSPLLLPRPEVEETGYGAPGTQSA